MSLLYTGSQRADEIKKKYGDKVRIVFELPTLFQRSSPCGASFTGSKRTRKICRIHDKLFANQKAMFEADLKKYAKELKLNMKKFNAALANKTYAAAVDADMKLGEKVGKRHTNHVCKWSACQATQRISMLSLH